jgi:hypothetical protein
MSLQVAIFMPSRCPCQTYKMIETEQPSQEKLIYLAKLFHLEAYHIAVENLFFSYRLK